jgi:hypothetical protein
VRNPDDPETPDNQVFLEVAAGFWLQLAMASETDCLGQLFAQFAAISRDLLAANTGSRLSPPRTSEQALDSSQQPDARAGIDARIASHNGQDNLALRGEVTSNMDLYEEELQAFNPMPTDPWHRNFWRGEETSWIDDILGFSSPHQ